MPSPIDIAKRQLTLTTHRIHTLPVVVLMPHSRCNCRCVMCDIWQANRNGHELSRDDLAAHLDDFRKLNVRWVVLSGGELPALLLIDALARRVPGVLGGEGSLAEETFEGGLLEYPQYTRPAEFRGWAVPELLRSGNHGAVDRWRRQQRLLRTRERRPDLLAAADLSPDERAWLDAAPDATLD